MLSSLSVDRHLGGFCILAVVNNAAVNGGVQISLQHQFSFLSGSPSHYDFEIYSESSAGIFCLVTSLDGFQERCD